MPSRSSSKSFLKTSHKSISSSKNNSDGTFILISIALLLFIIIAGTIIYNSYNREKFTVNNKLVYLYMDRCTHCKDFSSVWDLMVSEVKLNPDKYKITMEKYELNNDEVGKNIAVKNEINYAPAIILITPSKNLIYEGERTKEAIFKWVLDKKT
jgi:hypothetical protein